MAQEGYVLELIEWSQAAGLLAFAVSVQGPEDGFPVLLGVSVRSRQAGVIDLLPQAVERSGNIVCLVEHPERLGDSGNATAPHCSGEITFALWPDNTFGSEVARIPWRQWTYSSLGAVNSNLRVDACTAAYLDHDFMTMRERYTGALFWIACRPSDKETGSHSELNEIVGVVSDSDGLAGPRSFATSNMIDRIKQLFGRPKITPRDLLKTVRVHLDRIRTEARHPQTRILLDEVEDLATKNALAVYEKLQEMAADGKLHTFAAAGGGAKTWLVISAVPRNRRNSSGFFASEYPPGYGRYVDLWGNSPMAKTALGVGHSVMAQLLLYADHSVGLSVTPLGPDNIADCPEFILPEESMTKEDRRLMGVPV
jgi:hypothetical protein